MSNVRERGRPRTFDKEAALQKALSIFSRKGYESASLDELTSAMGINRPSLYAAFGNKENLFLQALDAYARPQTEKMRELLFNEANLHLAFKQFWFSLADAYAENSCIQGGCLLTNSTILSQADQQGFSAALQQYHDRNEAIFYQRLEQGLQAGELPADTDCRALASLFNSILAGLAVLARAQRRTDALHRIATQALAALPIVEVN